MQYKKKFRPYTEDAMNQCQEEVKQYFTENNYRITASERYWVPCRKLYLDFLKTVTTEQVPTQDAFILAVKGYGLELDRIVRTKTKLVKERPYSEKKQIKILTNVKKMD